MFLSLILGDGKTCKFVLIDRPNRHLLLSCREFHSHLVRPCVRFLYAALSNLVGAVPCTNKGGEMLKQAIDSMRAMRLVALISTLAL